MAFWDDFLAGVRDRFSDQQYRIFVSKIAFSRDGDTLTLTLPCRSAASWTRKNPVFQETLVEHARKLLSLANPMVRVVSEDDAEEPAPLLEEAEGDGGGKPPPKGNGSAKPAAPKKAPTAAPRPAGPVPIAKVAEAAMPRKDSRKAADLPNLNPRYTFESFVEGKANQLAFVAGAKMASGADVQNHNPLFIWGSVGLGKTHLAHAIGNRHKEAHPGHQVRYITANDFISEVVRAFRNNQAEEFKRAFHSLDMLILDDIQFIGGDKTRTQEEFSSLFNSLIDHRKPLVITCDRLPTQLKDFHGRLTSRFQWGLMVSIEPPELELRIGILQRKAEECGIDLDTHVARYIAERLKANVRELEGALRRVIAYAEFSGADITLELCRTALADILGSRSNAVTAAMVQEKVADYYKIKLGDLRSAKRTRTITKPRHIAIFLTRELTELSLPEVGKAFGGRNHTTVLHACKNVEKLTKQDDETVRDLKVLRQLITS